MSTPVCRYFLNSNCRFGDRCRFSHNVSDSSYNSNYSPPNPYVLNRTQSHDRQRYNEPKPNWGQNLSYNDIQEIIEKIRDEAKQVEFEKLWPLTCLSVLRDAPNVPGWDDYSMEELRTAAYSAKISGRFDEYVQLYQSLLQKAKDSHAIFLRPGKRAEELVKSMFEQRGQEGSKASSNFSFSQIPAFSRFSSTPSTGTDTVFGGSQTPVASNAFGSTASNAFGSLTFGSGASSQTPGIFAMAAQGFASNAPKGSVMNDTDMETAGESLLNQTSASGASPFHQNIFGQVVQKGSFATQGTGSVFGDATPSVFGATTPSDNTATHSVFGNSARTFGGAPVSNPFNSQGSFDHHGDSVYTPINELSESDLEQFKAATFTLNKLPQVPPPKELC